MFGEMKRFRRGSKRLRRVMLKEKLLRKFLLKHLILRKLKFFEKYFDLFCLKFVKKNYFDIDIKFLLHF